MPAASEKPAETSGEAPATPVTLTVRAAEKVKEIRVEEKIQDGYALRLTDFMVAQRLTTSVSRVGSPPASPAAHHRGRAWEPSQGSHVKRASSIRPARQAHEGR